ncbi:YegJ family protein [Acinetobacter calcoaceticus]|uniref:YegJ family protein n=1 Tax=Acinetobacter calcoaceticus TaxID=471 RepID=UPI00300BBDFA
MILAFDKAVSTFKYFWRELYWEYRRIIPALELAYVKCAFIQENLEDKNQPLIEYMWIDQIGFDGSTISGTLLNEPYIIDNVQAGETVSLQFDSIVDWIFLSNGTVHGGFTIQEYRKTLNAVDRKEYDEAWGIDFGNPDEIFLVYDQKDCPENLDEHPMCKNILDQFINIINTDPRIITEKDESGNQLLHREVLAGNYLFVREILSSNVNKLVMNNQSMTPLDLAHKMGWNNIVNLLK